MGVERGIAAEMNLTELHPFVSMAAAICAVAAALYTVFTKPGTKAQEAVDALAKRVDLKADADDVERLDTKLDHAEERLAVMESELKHLPDRETTHAMELTLREVQGQLAVLTERIVPMAKTSERLQDFLLSQGK